MWPHPYKTHTDDKRFRKHNIKVTKYPQNDRLFLPDVLHWVSLINSILRISQADCPKSPFFAIREEYFQESCVEYFLVQRSPGSVQVPSHNLLPAWQAQPLHTVFSLKES